MTKRKWNNAYRIPLEILADEFQRKRIPGEPDEPAQDVEFNNLLKELETRVRRALDEGYDSDSDTQSKLPRLNAALGSHPTLEDLWDVIGRAFHFDPNEERDQIEGYNEIMDDVRYVKIRDEVLQESIYPMVQEPFLEPYYLSLEPTSKGTWEVRINQDALQEAIHDGELIEADEPPGYEPHGDVPFCVLSITDHGNPTLHIWDALTHEWVTIWEAV